MHERFVEVQKPWADLVIEQPIEQTELSRLTAAIRALRAEPAPRPLEVAGSRATMPEVEALQSL